MMKKCLLIAAVPLFICLLSCSEKRISSARAFAFYDSVNHELSTNKDVQQRLIDRTLTIVLQINNDKNTIVDIRPLQVLFDSSRAVNMIRQKNIEKIEEVDPVIDYKAKVLDYVKAFNDFYKNEYYNFLIILEQPEIDRSEKYRTSFAAKLVEIKQKQDIFQDAQKEFKEKYQEEEGFKKVKGDIVYRNLSSLNYTIVQIPPGTKFKLLSYSGGQCIPVGLSYTQFIGINLTNGDTMRILAPCQSREYDFENTFPVGTLQENINRKFETASPDEMFVIFNNNLSDLEKGNYKTTIGVLQF
jgi:hypothetical protein